ncbi:MAG: hypothetical protein CMP67_04015 [Flavobacteriales bacterium]|nr:hypothetical protein [Flavobacteriales bacterium]
MQKINLKKDRKAAYLYVFLGGLFVAFLVVCNLIANKFVAVSTFFREEPFILSAGILPYPITFLITDLLSEFYGRKRTAIVIFTGFIASILIIAILKLGALFPSIEESPVSSETYAIVFGNSWRVIGASMIAYIMAQLIDVQLYEFWKKRTKGKMLWLRNNGSTIFSQLVDTILVVLVLFIGIKSYEQIVSIIIDGWVFKVVCAIVDTPIIYVSVFLIRRYFNLKPGEEIKF